LSEYRINHKGQALFVNKINYIRIIGIHHFKQMKI